MSPHPDGFSWEQGKSGIMYYVNNGNGRVVGTITPTTDENFFKVVDLRKVEVFYRGLSNAKSAIEAVPTLM